MGKGTLHGLAACAIVALAGMYGGACGKTVESTTSGGVGAMGGAGGMGGMGGAGGMGGCAPAMILSDASGSQVTVGGSAPGQPAMLCALIGPCPSGCAAFGILEEQLTMPVDGDCYKLVSVVSNGTQSPEGACCYEVMVQPISC